MAKSKKATTPARVVVVAAETFTVPLTMLDPSAVNVRRIGREAGIEELAALIESQGLLQPLGVTPEVDEAGQPTGRYGVTFGGRRLAALRLLATRQAIPEAAPIACRLVAQKDAAETSLAENSGRIAMHPADQAEAFAVLHAGSKGLAIDSIALRFGVSAHVVRQRLRIAGVAPAVLDAFKRGGLTLEQVMAFAVTEDAQAQEAALRQLGERLEYSRTPAHIRALLTQGEVPASDRRAAFVGAVAYEAAGGIVRRDLFTEDKGGWYTDPLLLDRLLLDRLRAEADAVRAEGWAWVDVALPLPDDAYRLRRVLPQAVPLSDEDATRLSELGARYDELAAGSDDLTVEQDAELEAVSAEIDALQAREEAFRPEDVAQAGAFVTFGFRGLSVERGYLRDGAAYAPGSGNGSSEEGATSQEADHLADDDAAAGATRSPSIPVPEPKVLPAVLAGELAAHRTAALQAEVATQPHLALCLLIEALATTGRSACRAEVMPPALRLACPGIASSAAHQHLADETARAGDRMPGGEGLVPWLMQQDSATLLGILAPLVARGIDAGGRDWTTREGATDPGARLAQLAGLDMRRWWTASTASYFGRVPKSLIADAVRDGAGEGAARRIEGLKKEPMADGATSLLDGKGWLPTMLRVP